MKILPLFLALALVLSVDSFAESRSHSEPKKMGHLSDVECSKYEIREDGFLYKGGRKILSIGETLSVYGGCLDNSDNKKNRIRGDKEYKSKHFGK